MVSSSHKGKNKAPIVTENISPEIPLGKQLAHTDKKVRDRAVQSLVAFLSRGAGGDTVVDGESSSGYVKLSEGEMSKLWKGLFYCYWMSDKPLIQQSLATDLSTLLLQISPSPSQSPAPSTTKSKTASSEKLDASLAYLEGFWKAIVREWSGLDRLRMDKFYLLIRKFVSSSFRLLASGGWDHRDIRRLNEDILGGENGPLSFSNPRVPISFAMHLADIYMEELDKVLALPEVNAQPPCPLLTLLSPFTTLLLRTPTQVLYTRLISALYIPLLTALELASGSIDTAETDGPKSKKVKRDIPVYAHVVLNCSSNFFLDGKGEKGGKEADSPARLRNALLKSMFIEASKPTSVESNRRKVYILYREEAGDDEEDDDE